MPYQILWIDDDQNFLDEMGGVLQQDWPVFTAASLGEGLKLLASQGIDLVLLDIGIGAENGLEGLQIIKEKNPSVDVVMVSGRKDPKLIVQAVRAGATDYICKPFDFNELTALIEKMQAVHKIRERHDSLIAELNPRETARRFIGVSPSFQGMIAHTNRLKGHTANVLIQGESGTGKEILARYINTIEDDSKRPFIAINCAAIPEGLIESELLGHERGAFTGATGRKIGKFELANGGDIFLDEISALRLDLQAKILRVIQEKEVLRVGGNQPVHVDFRVISATNDNLEALVGRGEFRMDLYHRLRVIQIPVPALRDRREDIPLLIAHFLEKYGKTSGVKRITSGALRQLQEYDWPGNVRELENVIQSMVILSPDEVIDEDCLPHWTSNEATNRHRLGINFPNVDWEDANAIPGLRDFIRAAERNFIEHVLRLHSGDKSAVASTLRLGRTTLYSKLKELGMM